jgi:hypothetical protein
VARGWESKAVEAQQEAAMTPRNAATARLASGAETLDDARRRGDRATLMLARTRALADLQHACAPAHRAMLEQAIAALDERLNGSAGA